MGSVMAKNLTDLRFAIKSSSGHVSSIWRLWATGHGDVYLATRSMAKIEKYSFHKSGICRGAFTNEHGTPQTMTDRAMFKWKRLPTPTAGERKASRVAWLGFPTDYLSQPPVSGVEVWLGSRRRRPAELPTLNLHSHESQESIEAAFRERRERKLLAYVALPSDEAFFGNYYHADWENKDLNMPGNGEVADLVFSPRNPYGSGRPFAFASGLLLLTETP